MSQRAITSSTVKRIVPLDMLSGCNASPQSNGLDVDGRGLIYQLDRDNDFDSLELER